MLGAHKKIVPSSVHVLMPLCCRHKSHLVLALSARCIECMGTEEEQVQAGAAARQWWAKLFEVHPRMTPPERTYVCDIPSSTLRVCFFYGKRPAGGCAGGALWDKCFVRGQGSAGQVRHAAGTKLESQHARRIPSLTASRYRTQATTRKMSMSVQIL